MRKARRGRKRQMTDDREIEEQDECLGFMSMRSVLELGLFSPWDFSEVRASNLSRACCAVGRSEGSKQLIHSSKGR